MAQQILVVSGLWVRVLVTNGNLTKTYLKNKEPQIVALFISSQNNQKFDRTYYNRYRQTNALTKIISMIIICIKRFLVNFSAAILICSSITSEIDYLVVE